MTALPDVPDGKFHEDFCTQIPRCRHLTYESEGNHSLVVISILKVSVFIFQVFV